MQFDSAAALVLRVAVVMIFVASISTGAQKSNNTSIIISAPLSCIGSQGEGRQEILSAAQAAVNVINDKSNILPNYDLQLILFDSCKDENELIQQVLAVTYYEPSRSVRGLTGFFSQEAISLLLPLVRKKEIVVTLPSETFVYGSQEGEFHITNPPTTMANILLVFTKMMKWERFGLITESADSYFFNVAVSLLQNDGTVVIAPYIELHHTEVAIHEIISYNTRVIILSLSAQRAAEMIHLIHKMGLLWPDYAWIFLSHNFSDQQAIYKAIRGIFVVESQLKLSINYLESNFTFCEQLDPSSLSGTADKANASLKHSGVANAFYDLVLFASINILSQDCIDNANRVSTQELFTIQYNDDTLFNIFHMWGQSKLLIGNVYSNLSITIVNETILEASSIDDLPITNINPPTGFTVGMVSLIILLAMFVTLVLLLYICFRKEPEVKATSFTLSLLLFVGCYFNLIYMSLHIYFHQPVFNELSISHQNTVCNLLLWLSGPGISLSLMFATLLVKMLRVYHIFNHITLRVRHYSSDIALILYILIILAPNIVVNIVWAIVDQYHAVIEYETRRGYIQLSKDCDSRYESVWFGVLCIYLLLLAVASAVVAIMTRKVRLQHFKDTKKVNVLIFILSLGIILTFSYWLLFQILRAKPYIVTIIGHSILILSFQCLLFVPKVFPPFWRYITRKELSQ